MVTDTELQAIAAEMRSAHADVRQIEPFTSRYPAFDLPSAYAVAGIIHQARVADGAVPVGRKLGFTNFDMWSAYGVREPVWAHVYDRTVSRVTSGDAVCSLGRFAEPMIEPEIVFHLGSTPPAGADLPEILGCVDWVAQGFEIVQSHFPGWKFRAADTVAADALHGTLLVGEPVPVERLAADPVREMASFYMGLFCDGQVRVVGKGADVLGSPLAALAHLVEGLHREPGHPPLEAGELVTTGTVTTAQAVKPGETWHTTIQGLALPDIAVRFTA